MLGNVFREFCASLFDITRNKSANVNILRQHCEESRFSYERILDSPRVTTPVHYPSPPIRKKKHRVSTSQDLRIAFKVVLAGRW
jgi:hypothetical protein